MEEERKRQLDMEAERSRKVKSEQDAQKNQYREKVRTHMEEIDYQRRETIAK